MFVPSKDGTRIPMFIVAHQNVTLDGNNPTYLYAYGGALMTDAFPSVNADRGAVLLGTCQSHGCLRRHSSKGLTGRNALSIGAKTACMAIMLKQGDRNMSAHEQGASK